MPLWIHRTTKQVLNSVPSADLPETRANYIEEPDLPPPPSKYWNIVGDLVTKMDRTEQDAVDAAETKARLDATVAELDAPNSLVGALAAVLLDLTGNTMTRDELKVEVRRKLGG